MRTLTAGVLIDPNISRPLPFAGLSYADFDLFGTGAQRPAHASVWLIRPLTATIAVRAGYDLDYTHFAGGGGTAADFVVPPSQVIHAARVAIDAQRVGWVASIWWNPARRQTWRAWGVAGRTVVTRSARSRIDYAGIRRR